MELPRRPGWSAIPACRSCWRPRRRPWPDQRPALGRRRVAHLAVHGRDGRRRRLPHRRHRRRRVDAIVSSYRSGVLSVVPISATGSLSEVGDTLEFVGSGPVTDRQEGPHAHGVVIHGDKILSCDLGGDQIYRLRLDEGVLVQAGDPVLLPAGFGPRHLVVVEDHLVVAGELSGGCGWRPGTATAGARCRSSRPRPATASSSHRGSPPTGPGLRGEPGCRHHLGLRRRRSGRKYLAPVAEFGCGGAWPRDISLDHGLLWVSSERSDTVAVFEVSPLPPARPRWSWRCPLRPVWCSCTTSLQLSRRRPWRDPDRAAYRVGACCRSPAGVRR